MNDPQQVHRRGSFQGDMSDVEVKAFTAALDEAAVSDELLDLQPYLSETARQALASFDVNLAKIMIVGRDGRKIGPIALAHFDPDEVVSMTGGGMVKASCFQAGIEPAYFKLHLPDSRERLAEAAGGQVSPESSVLNARIEALQSQVSTLIDKLAERENKKGDELYSLAMGCLADTLEAGKARRERDLSAEPVKPLSRMELIRESQKEIKLLREIAEEEAPPLDGSAEMSLLNRVADVGDKLADAFITSRVNGKKTSPASAGTPPAQPDQLSAADQAIIDAAGGTAA